MQCFYHNNAAAVAICKNCNKGLCPECAADLSNGVACKNRCEDEVLAINEIVERSKSAYQKTSAVYVQYSIWLGAAASLCLLAALIGRGIAVISVPAALLFLLGACLSYASSRKFKKREA